MAQQSNPFYVEPLGGYAPAVVQGIGQLGRGLGEQHRAEQQAQSLFKNEQTRKNLVDSTRAILTNPERAEEIIRQRAEFVTSQGGDPSDTLAALDELRSNPQGFMENAKVLFAEIAPEQYKSFAEGREPQAGAKIGTYNPRDYTVDSFSKFAESGNPADLERFTEKTIDIGGVPYQKMDDGTYKAVTTAPTVAANKALITKAVEKAKASVKAVVDSAAGKKSNEVAWGVYDTGMRNLADAMSETTTAPGMAWMPAVTANQQIAEGAVSVMAPVLKQMFRASGEGVFTDKDQQMLMGMVPTRDDHPEARAAKIQAIDAIVRAKLNMSEGGEIKTGGAIDWSDL